MKVAIYVPHGAVKDRRGFAPAIVAYNHAINLKVALPYIISAREDYKNKFSIENDIHIYRIQESRIYRRLFRKITRLDPYPLHQRAAKISKRIKPDIFHAHQLEFPVRDFRRKFGRDIPIIVHSHVSTGKDYSAVHGTADRYIAPSIYVKDRLVNTKQYPEDLMTVIYNGVDTSLFSPPLIDELKVLRSQYNIPDDAIVVSFMGRKQEGKGYNIFLRIAETLINSRSDIFFLAAGPTPDDVRKEKTYRERIELSRKLQMGRNYLEYPAIDHVELSKLFKLSDITLLPSKSEPQGMVMIESMSTGCVTISSNVCGIKESITHGETGYLIEDPGSFDEIMTILISTIDNYQNLSDIKIKSRKQVLEKFDWKIISLQLDKLYSDLLR